jgi:uncharacterized protein YukE
MSTSPVPPANFEPLDSGNGVPGDAGEVTALARRYADTAAEIEAQAANLRRLTSQARSGWKGEAGEKFTTIAGDLAERIAKAKDRYEAAAQAVMHFGDGLDDVQREAYDAVRRAQAAEEEQRALQASVPTTPGPSATAEELALAGEDRRRHQNAVSAAATRLSRAREDYGTAVGAYHDLAGVAARMLRDGRADDGLADSWWDRNAGWLSVVLDVISAIALVLTIAAVVIAVFATGGAFAAAIVPLLMMGSTVLGGVALGGHFGLWLTDNGSGEDVLWDLAGVLTFGLGKGVAAGARGMLGLTSRVGARAAATTAGRTAFTIAGRSGLLYDLGRLVPFARPVLSLSPGVRAASAAADTAAAGARAGVMTAAATVSTGLSRGLAFADGATAQALTAINRINGVVPGSRAVDLLTGLANTMVVGGVTVPSVVTNGKGVLDVHTNFFAEPAEQERDQAARAEIVDQWSMPLLHVK